MELEKWQEILKHSLKSLPQLLDAVNLKIEDFEEQLLNNSDFQIKVTPSFIKKISLQNPKDPLLLQILPFSSETKPYTNFSLDPLLENKCNPEPGIIHKFHGRVLVTMTAMCPIHCRYCFRKNFSYNDNLPNTQNIQTLKKYLHSHPEIHEVILSGGDPLIHNDNFLLSMLNMIAEIPNVTVVRFHTRVPIALPERITNNLITTLTATRLNIVLVTHCNHPQELQSDNLAAIKKLKSANIILFNQSVLLNNINNNADTLIKLSYKLLDYGIIPYYLHMLDKVYGSHRFLVPDEKAISIHQELLTKLPGYLVPRLVREVPDMPYKIPISAHSAT